MKIRLVSTWFCLAALVACCLIATPPCSAADDLGNSLTTSGYRLDDNDYLNIAFRENLMLNVDGEDIDPLTADETTLSLELTSLQGDPLVPFVVQVKHEDDGYYTLTIGDYDASAYELNFKIDGVAPAEYPLQPGAVIQFGPGLMETIFKDEGSSATGAWGGVFPLVLEDTTVLYQLEQTGDMVFYAHQSDHLTLSLQKVPETFLSPSPQPSPTPDTQIDVPLDPAPNSVQDLPDSGPNGDSGEIPVNSSALRLGGGGRLFSCSFQPGVSGPDTEVYASFLMVWGLTTLWLRNRRR